MLNRAFRKPSAKKPRSRQEGRYSQVEGRILQLRDEGHTWRMIADKINDDGFRAPRGGKWSAPQVFRVAKRLDVQRLEGAAGVQRFVVKRRAGIASVATVLLVALFTMHMFPASTGDKDEGEQRGTAVISVTVDAAGLSSLTGIVEGLKQSAQAVGTGFQTLFEKLREAFKKDDNNPEESIEEVGRGMAQLNQSLEGIEEKLVEARDIQEDLIQKVQLIRQILEIAGHKLMSARQNVANDEIGRDTEKLFLEILAGLTYAEHLEDLQELLANLRKP